MYEEINPEDVVVLYNEDGQEERFGFVDIVPYEDKEYVVLLPLDKEDGQVLIMELVEMDDDTEGYIPVNDEDTLNAVLNLLMEGFTVEVEEVEE